MSFELPPLPFPKDGLEPHMSTRTLEFHYGKHHQTYVATLNKLLEGSPLASQSLEAIIRATAKDESKRSIFNNAAQVWNHTFFWNSLKPGGGGKPGGDLLKRIEQGFGDFDKFKEQFKAAAVGQFGSGWAWLVLDQGKLAITKTPDAVNPMVQGQTALLACDVWEHAYYLDYQNRRADFVGVFLDHLVNWGFAAKNLSSGH
jgi:superoxide dismutase, Fe-Mn family